MRIWVPPLYLVFAFLLCPILGQGQLSIIIDELPGYTPKGDSIYLATSLNDWNPGHPQYRFQKNGEGQWLLQVPQTVGEIKFKLTRGDWSTVEGGRLGDPIFDRIYTGSKSADTLHLKVLSWEDMRDSIPFERTVLLRLVRVPTNTPADANIYVTGNFNDWSPKDDRYRLEATEGGVYEVRVPLFFDTLSYKFTRGNWESSEGRRNGRARQNRLAIFPDDETPKPQTLRVESWEDLYGSPFNGYTLVLLLAALQGLFLIVAMQTMQNNNRRANQILSILLFLIILSFLARVGTYDRDIFQGYPKLILVPDLIYFLYGPLFVAYMRALLIPPQQRAKWGILHFIPAVLHLCLYLPLIFRNSFDFIIDVVNYSYRPLFIATAAAALIFNTFYWWRGYRLLQSFRTQSEREHSFDQNLRFLYTVMYLHGLCLLVWLATYIVGGIGWLTGQELTPITDPMTDGVWLLAALTLYCLGYFAMRQPAIFQLPLEDEIVPKEEAEEEEKTNNLAKELVPLKVNLIRIMEEDKPFLNPRLTLSELSELSDIQTHSLSRLINEGFDKNFFDFVNAYRVEEFKKLIVQEPYNQQTFFAVALEVGFNSKTAFNRAFKKYTDQTPREYLASTK